MRRVLLAAALFASVALGGVSAQGVISGGGTISVGTTGSAGGTGAGGGLFCTTNADCTAPKTCWLGFCADRPAAGTQNGPCLAGGTCNDGLTCIPSVNTCASAGSDNPPASSGGTTNPGVALGGSCTTLFDCRAGLVCQDGKCAAFKPVSSDCSTNPCTSTQECFFGTCLNKLPEIPCTPACNTDYGETCDTRTGICRPAAAPRCGDSCPAGSCLPPQFPGFPPVCARPAGGGGSQSCTVASDCLASGENTCTLGKCASCGDLCTALARNGTFSPAQRDQFLELLGQIGSAGQFSQFQPPSEVRNQINGQGQFQPPAGAVAQLDANAFGGLLQQLNFANGASAAQIQPGQIFSIPRIDASANANGQLLVGARGRVTNCTVNIPTNGALTVSLADGNSTNPSIAAFARLILSGPLNVVGAGSNAVLALPENGDVTANAGAAINIQGQIALRGNAAGAKINLAGDDAKALIGNGFSFTASGTVLGQTATMEVTGTLDFSGTRFEPQLTVKATGQVRIASPASGEQLRLGNLTFDESANGQRELRINGTDANGGKGIFFGTMKNCPATATVTFKVPGDGRDAALQAGITVMNYGAATKDQTDLFVCNLQVCDDTGCTAIRNPNVQTASGRRLLATGGDASFSATSLTFTAGQSSSAASTAVSSMILAIALLLAAIMQRM